jgi:hypothetical protein
MLKDAQSWIVLIVSLLLQVSATIKVDQYYDQTESLCVYM